MTKITFYDGTQGETPLTHNQIAWLREQAQAGWIVCKLHINYEGVPTSVNVLDVQIPKNILPAEDEDVFTSVGKYP